METMLLLAGPRDVVKNVSGSHVAGRQYNDLDPLSICDEYGANVHGVMVQNWPPVGKAVMSVLQNSQELDDDFAERLASAVSAALEEPSAGDYAVNVTNEILVEWIARNKGNWVVQVYL